jgi:site-specific DNA-methyltransferase (adenine-specific)
MYRWLPVQSWDRTWTDADLYKKYGITHEEQAFIESVIRPMNVDDE